MKIGVIFTGGTIGSRLQENGIAPSPQAPHALLAAYAAKSGDRCAFSTAEPYTLLSEQLTLSHIGVLAACVKEKAQEWDAIIVTHGTDTLQYTGAALGYILGLSCKPTVLVSANFPIEDRRSNGVTNFCAAVSFLRRAKDARGVFAAYGSAEGTVYLHRATRLLPHLPLDDKLFSQGGAVATVTPDGTVDLLSDYAEQPDAQATMQFDALSAAEGRILRLWAYPGMSCPSLDGIAAVLIDTYHSGTLPTAALPLRMLAKKAKDAHIPVVLVGVPTGGTAYESGNAYAALGFFSAPPLSPIAAYIKLCLALANGRDPFACLALPLGGDL